MQETTDNHITTFARTNHRNGGKRFGIKQADRRSHIYVVGKTGTGKSTLLETMIRQDVVAGRGAALVDPHGDLVEGLLDWLPESRRDDLIYFDATDTDQPLGFNPLAGIAPDRRPLAASQIIEAFRNIWEHSWGPRLEYILRHTLLALLSQPEATFSDVLRMLTDEDYRERTAKSSPNPEVRRFWLKEFDQYHSRLRVEAISPIQNKVGALVANPILRNILTQRTSDIDPRALMDEGKILLVNLSKGQIGADNAKLLGSLLVSRIGLAALSRSDVPEEERRDFHLYLDEFHGFTTPGLAEMLSELRKYRLGMTLAHQHLAQLDEPTQEAVLGNAGTLVSFRIGPRDAEVLEREFAPEFSASDLTRLPNYRIYLKLLVDGRATRPFSAETLLPEDGPNPPAS